ncbi:MAG TPA: ankyrin repeat domain-containing protein [Planctomycetota bacterium]|nr:ankyrin repeat domain-containing protein [Planctomycetota bacterium]
MARPDLATLLEALVENEAEAVRIVKARPELATERVVADRLFPGVHWTYVGDTALHLAAAALRPFAVRALLAAGADPNAENRRGAIALHYACDPRPWCGNVRDSGKQRRVIEHLIDAGSRIEHAEKAGAAPLHRAVRARSPEAVRCLLERGASVHTRHGKQRSTPLHLALHSTGAGGTRGARAEQDEIVALLLAHGANPRARDAKGKTPPLGKRRD